MKCKRPLDYQTLAEGPDNDVSIRHQFPQLTNCDLRSIARTVTRTPTGTSRRRTCTTQIAASSRVRKEKQMSALAALERSRDPSNDITPAPTRCSRLRSRLPSQGATTGSVSPAPSASTRWIQPTLQTDPTTRCFQHLYSPFYSPQIYCVHCYELIHGKKAKTKSMPLDTTSIMGEAELGTCPRCSGKVFSAEKMVAASGHYHRHCFRCFTCNQPLDSTR